MHESPSFKHAAEFLMDDERGSSAPRVSVITPVRNACSTLLQTIASVQAQTFPDWEMLLIDDGSTDGSVELIERLASRDPRLRLIRSQTRHGASGARNLGIRLARGRFIAFLDADDVWLPEKLACQVPRLEAGAGIVFSSYRRISPEGRHLGVVHARPRVQYRDALGGNPIGCLTGVWDRERFGRAQMPELPMREDYAFWLNLLRQGATAEGLPDVLAEYRVSRNSRSSRKFRAARATWGVLHREVGFARANVGFALYVVRSIRRRLGNN
jgi:teichuronic acid biosynthesis glycosyltransferase TuaG